MQFAYKPQILRGFVSFHHFILNEVWQLDYFEACIITKHPVAKQPLRIQFGL